jgi:hypothetical protein
MIVFDDCIREIITICDRILHYFIDFGDARSIEQNEYFMYSLEDNGAEGGECRARYRFSNDHVECDALLYGGADLHVLDLEKVSEDLSPLHIHECSQTKYQHEHQE